MKCVNQGLTLLLFKFPKDVTAINRPFPIRLKKQFSLSILLHKFSQFWSSNCCNSGKKLRYLLGGYQFPMF